MTIRRAVFEDLFNRVLADLKEGQYAPGKVPLKVDAYFASVSVEDTEYGRAIVIRPGGHASVAALKRVMDKNPDARIMVEETGYYLSGFRMSVAYACDDAENPELTIGSPKIDWGSVDEDWIRWDGELED